MKEKTVRKTLAILAAALLAARAPAGLYIDDFSRCLVDRTSAGEKTFLVQWMFAAMSAGPAVQGMSTVTADQRADYNKRFGVLISRLMTETCRTPLVAALKNEGSSAIEAGFNTLGTVAGRALMTDPAVGVSMSELEKDVDKDRLKAVFAEAGRIEPKK